MENELLSVLRQSFERGFREKDVVVGDFTYHMQTLNGQEAQWRDQYCSLSWTASFLSSRKIPTLAMTIRAINNIPVTQLFPDAHTATKKSEQALMAEQAVIPGSSGYDTLQFRAAKLFMEFLSTEVPEDVIDSLFNSYQEHLAGPEEKAVKEVLKTEGRTFPESSVPESAPALSKGPDDGKVGTAAH